jgi:hypothetical protein
MHMCFPPQLKCRGGRDRMVVGSNQKIIEQTVEKGYVQSV